MNRDIVGERGESLFRVAISKWCGGKPWFQATFLGEKSAGLDFEVTLLDPTVFRAMCFVQVKATAKAIWSSCRTGSFFEPTAGVRWYADYSLPAGSRG